VHKVEQFAISLSTIYLRVEDLGDLEFVFSIYFDQRWRRLYAIRNGIWNGEFQLGDMEDWMTGCMNFMKSGSHTTNF